jgi:hypothetical protein
MRSHAGHPKLLIAIVSILSTAGHPYGALKDHPTTITIISSSGNSTFTALLHSNFVVFMSIRRRNSVFQVDI